MSNYNKLCRMRLHFLLGGSLECENSIWGKEGNLKRKGNGGNHCSFFCKRKFYSIRGTVLLIHQCIAGYLTSDWHVTWILLITLTDHFLYFYPTFPPRRSLIYMYKSHTSHPLELFLTSQWERPLKEAKNHVSVM